MTAEPLPGVAECARLVRDGQASASELVERALSRIESSDADVQAFTIVDAERARSEAQELDRLRCSGRGVGPLAGVPIAVKDLIDVEGLPSSYGSPALAPAPAMSDADCVRRLRSAGAIPVGKTRTSELAWCPDTPPTDNPAWPGHVCGGSSGGSAAAVAAGMVPVALGTDTGGSVRWPAAACGVAGVKPTFGLISCDGVLPTSWSLDHVGLIAPCPDDLLLVLGALSGDSSDGAPETGRPARIGVLDSGPFGPASDWARSRFRQALESLAESRVEIQHLELPSADLATPVLNAISLADGAALWPGLSRDNVPAGVAAQLELGRVIPSALVRRAEQVRAQICDQTRSIFRREHLDALLTPATVVALPRRRGGRQAPGGESAETDQLDACSRPYALANATGQPAVVLPLAPDANGPFAVQLLGRPFLDRALLHLAATLHPALAG